MRVLFAGMKWDYGDPNRGLSHEHTNLYDSLARMPGLEVHHFDFMATHQEGGSELVGRRLRETVDHLRPQLLFCVLFEDEVPAEVLEELRDRPEPFTFNWFADDHWRFERFTRRYAPLFNGCSTTAQSALPKYARLRYDHVVKTQWAANPNMYRPCPTAPRREVTFVGQPHGDRRKVIERLRDAGIEVATWGHGWPSGRLSHHELVEVFAGSRINLNLSNSSMSFDLGSRIRRRLGSRTRLLADQIKGRNFEIPACGGFQISGTADDLEAYFEPDEEIVLYDSTDELVEIVRRYRSDEESRRRIAAAGLRRTLAEHTYAHRFAQIFREFDLPYRATTDG